MALGVIAATAVLTGALVVGDSVRGSLPGFRSLPSIPCTRHRQVFSGRTGQRTRSRSRLCRALLDCPASGRGPGHDPNPTEPHGTTRECSVIGSDERFWKLGAAELTATPSRRATSVSTSRSADKLAAKVRSVVVLRIGSMSKLANSPLGRRRKRFVISGLTLPASSSPRVWADLGLHPTQQMPLDALPGGRNLASRVLDQPGLVNAIFVGGRAGFTTQLDDGEALQAMLHPTQLRLCDRPHQAWLLALTSKRMMVEPAAGASTVWSAKPLTALTYLANSITKGEQSMPYSTVAALTSPPSRRWDRSSHLAATNPPATCRRRKIALNTWATEDLGARLGDTIELTSLRA